MTFCKALVFHVWKPQKTQVWILYGSFFIIYLQTDFVRSSHPDQKFMEAANDTCGNLSGLVEK